MEMYIKCWKHCTDFSGRASRNEFWNFFSINFVLSLVLSVIAYWILDQYSFFIKISLSYSLAALLPGIAVAVRRLHDLGRSGMFMLLGVIPVLGLIALLFMFAMPGEKEENSWGVPVSDDVTIS